jgi:hypothetical protein
MKESDYEDLKKDFLEAYKRSPFYGKIKDESKMFRAAEAYYCLTGEYMPYALMCAVLNGDGGMIEQSHELICEYKKAIKKEENRSGYIYLLKSKHGVKIGRTINPKSRISDIQVQIPFGIEEIANYVVFDMYKKEKELHEKYKTKRLKGEWFNLSMEEIREIQHYLQLEENQIKEVIEKLSDKALTSPSGI